LNRIASKVLTTPDVERAEAQVQEATSF